MGSSPQLENFLRSLGIDPVTAIVDDAAEEFVVRGPYNGRWQRRRGLALLRRGRATGVRKQSKKEKGDLRHKPIMKNETPRSKRFDDAGS